MTSSSNQKDDDNFELSLRLLMHEALSVPKQFPEKVKQHLREYIEDQQKAIAQAKRFKAHAELMIHMVDIIQNVQKNNRELVKENFELSARLEKIKQICQTQSNSDKSSNKEQSNLH